MKTIKRFPRLLSIEDVERQAGEKFPELLKELGLLPEGYECSVRLYGESRKKRRTAPLDRNWHPETDFVKIGFERTRVSPQPRPDPVDASPRTANAAPAVSGPLEDLILALDRAESRPGYRFVALKWFRDTVLTAAGFPWASSDAARKSVLGEAIDNKLVLTSSVPNPNSPYPTTAVRLNRLMPQVQAILGIEGKSLPDFAPLPIRGESLSATILRDRR
jgi:hypothetical protein